jgi:hypothetical protein
MAVLVVTNTNDSGAGSLRDAVAQANADATSADTIVCEIPGGSDDHDRRPADANQRLDQWRRVVTVARDWTS